MRKKLFSLFFMMLAGWSSSHSAPSSEDLEKALPQQTARRVYNVPNPFYRPFLLCQELCNRGLNRAHLSERRSLELLRNEDQNPRG